MNGMPRNFDRYYDPPEPPPLWCPICNCDSESCVQPEDEEQDNGDGPWMEVFTVEGHMNKWIGYDERDAPETEPDEVA